MSIQHQYTIFSPLISTDDKLMFLRHYVSRHAKTENGKLTIKIANPNGYEEYLLNCLGTYLETHRVSLGRYVFKNPHEASERLRNMISSLNFRFNLYVQANDDLHTIIKNYLKHDLTAPPADVNPRFLCEPPAPPKTLPYHTLFEGINPKWQVRTWQTDFINATRERWLWGNAYGTGLGKTSTALMAVHDRQLRFPHERAMFVVPSATLNKWFKECFLPDLSGKPCVFKPEIAQQCLFINLLSAKEYKKLVSLSAEEVKKAYPNDLFAQHINQHPQQYAYLTLSLDEQLALAKDPSYNKIFMSHEHFYRYRLKNTTAQSYVAYLQKHNSDLSRLEFTSEKTYLGYKMRLFKILHESQTGKSKQDLFLEDMNVALLVIDEAHTFKNSKELLLTSENGTNYSSLRYLANAPASNRALDMLAKAHYIRERSPSKEGILALTATPITNSPIEIYGFLSLVMGEATINHLFKITGLNDFLDLFSQVDNEFADTIDQTVKEMTVFKGLNNLKLLRQVLHKVVYYVNDEDKRVQNSIQLPQQQEQLIGIELSVHQHKEIDRFIYAYQQAKRQIAEIKKNATEEVSRSQLLKFIKQVEPLPPADQIAERFDETLDIIASPFNLMNKFENLLLDEDLLEKACVFFISPDYQHAVAHAIKAFNQKQYGYSQLHKNPHTGNSVLRTKEKTALIGAEEVNAVEHTYHAQAYRYDPTDSKRPQRIVRYCEANQKRLSYLFPDSVKKLQAIDFDKDLMIVVDSQDPTEHQAFFEECLQAVRQDQPHTTADTLSHALKFNWSSKLFTALNQVRMEQQQPRGKHYDGTPSSLVKQLIFCDHLPIYFKLVHLLHQLTDLPLAKIAVLTGQINGENDEVLQVQEGYNGEGENNAYQIVLANKKGEYGIDLQNGTQAIHHLTISWTPDSQTQRNGRGVRQGNQTQAVRVYHYLAEGTFDRYKQAVVGVKDDWIKQLFQGEIDHINIVQTVSREQREKMLALMGNKEQWLAYQKEQQAIQLQRHREKVRQQQERLLHCVVNHPFTQDHQHSYNQYLSIWLDEFANLHTQRTALMAQIMDKISLQAPYKDPFFWTQLKDPQQTMRQLKEAQEDRKTILKVNDLCKINGRINDLTESVFMHTNFTHLPKSAYCPMAQKSLFNTLLAQFLRDHADVANKSFYLNHWLGHQLMVRWIADQQGKPLTTTRLRNLSDSTLFGIKKYLNEALFNQGKALFDTTKSTQLYQRYQKTAQLTDKLKIVAQENYLQLCQQEKAHISFSPLAVAHQHRFCLLEEQACFPHCLGVLLREEQDFEHITQVLRQIMNEPSEDHTHLGYFGNQLKTHTYALTVKEKQNFYRALKAFNFLSENALTVLRIGETERHKVHDLTITKLPLSKPAMFLAKNLYLSRPTQQNEDYAEEMLDSLIDWQLHHDADKIVVLQPQLSEAYGFWKEVLSAIEYLLLFMAQTHSSQDGKKYSRNCLLGWEKSTLAFEDLECAQPKLNAYDQLALKSVYRILDLPPEQHAPQYITQLKNHTDNTFPMALWHALSEPSQAVLRDCLPDDPIIVQHTLSYALNEKLHFRMSAIKKGLKREIMFYRGKGQMYDVDKDAMSLMQVKIPPTMRLMSFWVMSKRVLMLILSGMDKLEYPFDGWSKKQIFNMLNLSKAFGE